MSSFSCTSDDLERLLTAQDHQFIDSITELYRSTLKVMPTYDGKNQSASYTHLVSRYAQMGERMQNLVKQNTRIKVYSFSTPPSVHGEASRVIAKLRNKETQKAEFIYYIQRAYEMLFHLVFAEPSSRSKNHLIIPTPVTHPVQNYAVHKIPDIDADIDNLSLCVILRGALLPSMIVSKEIQEYSSYGKVTPFALFDIKRQTTKNKTKQYVINLDRCFFNLENLHGADILLADPMNATAGSLYTFIKYLESQKIVPRKYLILNVISSVEASLRLMRCNSNIYLYTLWMDPVLNDSRYIMPGLGDAGDRINGVDSQANPRNIIQLIADYGSHIANLYRYQIRAIEQVVLRE